MTPSADTTCLARFLDSADATHAEQPAATAAALLARAAGLTADPDGARALRLAEHVALAHLADTAALAALLAAVPAALAQAEPTAGTLQRLHWSLAMVNGTAVPAPPPATQRWRALQNVVLALAAQQRWAEAADLLSADELAARADGAGEAGRAYASSVNNVAMDLQTSGPPPGAPRDAARDALMLQAATIARRAWGHAGTWQHAERAEYRLALCHAVAGDGAAALHHARLCLAGCEVAGADADVVEHFFVQEALVRAHLAAGDTSGAVAAHARMQALLPQIGTADGLQAWCAEVLADLPATPPA